MSQDINSQLENMIRVGERLLEEYEKSKKVLSSTTGKAGDSIVSAFAGAMFGDLVGNGRAGSTARKVTREYLNEQRKKKIK